MRGVISAGHELTAKAGIDILESGGNAFDAAVAAVFASFICESSLTSPGGGGFFMAHTEAGETKLYDFFTDAPGRGRGPDTKDISFYSTYIDFADTSQELFIGEGSVAVPGCIAGLKHVYERHCSMPLPEIMAPAIYYAREGIAVNAQQACFNRILSPMLTASEESRKIYEPHGKPLKEGDRFFNKSLADTFEFLSREGLEKFYEGEIAERILEGFAVRGLITEEDLRSYSVVVREPLEVGYRGRRIFTNPPPSSGGCLVAFSLKLLEAFDLAGLGHNRYPYLKLLFDVMRATNEARREDFDHRVFEQGLINTFLSEENIKTYRERLTHPGLGNTTHISVVDKVGNAAGVTTSTGIGCGFMIPGTGIMMNNMLGEEDLNPHGFHTQDPGTRLSSMMAPTIVMSNERPEIVLGSGGSKRIRSAILQVIVNIIDHHLPVFDAVNSARVHGDETGFEIEEGVPGEDIDLLEKQGLPVKRWKEKHMYFGGVNTVFMGSNGEITGSGDLRRGGVRLKTA